MGDGQKKVFVNDSYKANVNGEEEAYTIIQNDVGIKPLKLGYIPSNMNFLDLTVEDGYASLRFKYEGEFVYVVQSKFDRRASFNCNSETNYSRVVYNKWIAQDFDICREQLSNGKYRYECSIVIDGISYCIAGVSSEEEFVKIIERLTY